MRGLAVFSSVAACAIAVTAFATLSHVSKNHSVPTTNPPVIETSWQKPVLNVLVPPISFPTPRATKDQHNFELFGDPSKRHSSLFLSPHAHAHPHGHELCASGCALSNHPTEKLSKTTFQRLISEFAAEPMSEDSEALESLLFYGSQTQKLAESVGTYPLDQRRAAFLSQQLHRNHAVVSFRIVDERNAIRATLAPTRVPLDIRHEFQVDRNRLQPMEASGTVKRVGLHHLWTRI